MKLKGRKIVNKIPEGWKEYFPSMCPKGYRAFNNNKSLFSGQRETVYIKK